MALKRHQKFWEDVERKWSEKYFQFLERNINKEWYWSTVSCNPSVSIEIIENNLNKPWDWFWISTNSSISLEIIENNLDKPWDWRGISQNPNVTIEFIFIHVCMVGVPGGLHFLHQ